MGAAGAVGGADELMLEDGGAGVDSAVGAAGGAGAVGGAEEMLPPGSPVIKEQMQQGFEVRSRFVCIHVIELFKALTSSRSVCIHVS